METWAAVRKIRQQREELRLYMLSINPGAWNEFVKIEGQIRKQRQQEEEARRRKVRKTIEITILVCAMILVSFAFALLVWWVLYLKETA